MVPPRVLDVRPGHRVLDMCASPGSKTQQLIEGIAPPVVDAAAAASGFVIANDAEYRRCHLLTHQRGVAADAAGAPRAPTTARSRRLVAVFHVGHAARYLKHLRLRLPAAAARPCSTLGTLQPPRLWRRVVAAPRLRRPPRAARPPPRPLRRAWPAAASCTRRARSTRSRTRPSSPTPSSPMPKTRSTPPPPASPPSASSLPPASASPASSAPPACRAGRCATRAAPATTARRPASSQRTTSCRRTPTRRARRWRRRAAGGRVRRLQFVRCMRVLEGQQDTGGFFIAVFERLPTAADAAPAEAPPAANAPARPRRRPRRRRIRRRRSASARRRSSTSAAAALSATGSTCGADQPRQGIAALDPSDARVRRAARRLLRPRRNLPARPARFSRRSRASRSSSSKGRCSSCSAPTSGRSCGS